MLEDLCPNEANEKIEDEALVTLLISLSNDEIVEDILSERDELIVHSENIELLEVGSGYGSREDGIAAVAQATERVVTTAVNSNTASGFILFIIHFYKFIFST